MGLTGILVLLYAISLCNSDFFSELNDVINSLTTDTNKHDDQYDGKMRKKYGASSDTDATVEALTSFFGGECVYKCTNGKHPQLRPSHKPSANGCGPSGMFEMGEPYLSGMTECCDAHDLCYDTCNKPRAKCDAMFQKCLHMICDEIPKSVLKTIPKNDCKKVADVLYSGTVALGCSFYLDAQKKACTCGTANVKKNYQNADTKLSKEKANDDQYKLSNKNKRNIQSTNNIHMSKIEL